MTLTNPLRPAILAAAKSDRMKRTITAAPITKKIVGRFVAGERRPEVAAVARTMLASGRAVSIDYLGENTTDRARADATVAEYLSLIGDLAALPVPDSLHRPGVRPIEVSVKLSALGQALPIDGAEIARDNARIICAAADEHGAWVTVDAEDHTTTDSTLEIIESLRSDFPWIGAVIQAYLHRSVEDCRSFAGPGSRVRLCKGAYREPAAVAYQSRPDITESYLRCLEALFDGAGYPMIASHDPEIIEAAPALTGGSTSFEYQMLYGIRDLEQQRIAASGATMRVYVPYGNQWYGYLMRRLAERPSNLRFFLRSLATRS